MKHICDTKRDYFDAMNTGMRGDTIYCSEKLWKELFDNEYKSQPERLNPEESEVYSEFGCSMPICFNTSEGVKTMMPGKRYDKNLNEIGLCDSPNSGNK